MSTGNLLRMASMPLIAVLLAGLFGCVSTTTGPTPAEPDEAEAAEQYYQLGARYYRAGRWISIRASRLPTRPSR